MSKKNSKTTTSGLNWNEMLGLLQRLKREERIRDYMLIATGCYLGLRASDLLNLKWIDIIYRDELIITERKTGKQRSMTVNPNLREILSYCKNYLVSKGIYDEHNYLFTNRWNQPISIQYINRRLHKIFPEYNIKVQHPSTHTLRKTFGKRVWEMDGKSERALIYLSQIFNHSNSMVTRKYIGIVQEDISNIYLGL